MSVRTSMRRAVLAAGMAALLGGVASEARAEGCSYQGVPYSDGAESCQQGAVFQCLGGQWVDQDQACEGQYGGPEGRQRLDTGGEVPAGTDDPFLSGDAPVAPVDPGDAGSGDPAVD